MTRDVKIDLFFLYLKLYFLYNNKCIGVYLMDFIKGNFRKYIFKTDKGYTVGLFKIKDTSDNLFSYKGKTVTFTGYFTDLNESDLYILNGSFVEHERYGEQFSVTSYEVTLPNDEDNVIDFLSSNLFPGIGEAKARSIVSVLGDNCLETILNNPDCLFLVPKITKKQRDTIAENLNKYEQSYKTIVELNKFGFNTKDSILINNKYKAKTIDIVNDDVYKLVDDIFEISFKKIDSLRSNFNITDDDNRRIVAGIKYVMAEVSYTLGNTYFTLAEITFYTKRALFIFDEDKIINGINYLIELGEIICEDDKYFYYKMYEAEKGIADRISIQSKIEPRDIIKDIDITDLEDFYGIEYSTDQKKAIKAALANPFLVITGGPGTGKTTIIKAICRLYQKINGFNTAELTERLALLAPTGRAAKRIAEQTQLPAYTIHRFLKWNKEDNTFNINENNKSQVKFVIVDETSMVDTYLLFNLFQGLKDNTKIILIGDYNQLPSVGPGQILKDIVSCDMINVIKLNKLYRQKETSNINVLAYNINNNIFDMDIFNLRDDLTFIETNSDNLKDYLKEYVIKYKDKSFNEFICLAPIYKNENGINDLNFFMQDILNPKKILKQEIIIDGITYRENDKVIELVNMVDENVFNGDIGRIVKIKNTNPKEVLIDFDSNIVRFTPNIFSNFTLGYTISIHKSQGSEFDIVVIPIINKYSNMLYKKLIYTATTRAKKKIILIGEVDALKRAILNDRENDRKTNLLNFINYRMK